MAEGDISQKVRLKNIEEIKKRKKKKIHQRHNHANWKNTDKWWLTCFKSILKINSIYNLLVIYPWNLLFS